MRRTTVKDVLNFGRDTEAMATLGLRIFSALMPRPTYAGACRWMGRVPLFWRRLPPPPGYMGRAEPIQYEDIGMSYLVHSGREYRRVKVTAQMVGHKYGEFVLTRKRHSPWSVKDSKTRKKR